MIVGYVHPAILACNGAKVVRQFVAPVMAGCCTAATICHIPRTPARFYNVA
jgi:hypothetical protein